MYHLRMKYSIVICAIIGICCQAFPQDYDLDNLHPLDTVNAKQNLYEDNPEHDAQFWYDKADKELKKRAGLASSKVAKNIILFMGDGMSVPTLAATRFFMAEKNNKRVSESEALSFENFLFTGLSRTYCTDSQVADSACSATAYLGGAKGNKGTIGVAGRVALKDAKASLDEKNRVNSISVLAQKAGKATGFVTNTRVTHASPAGTFAHVAYRDWESDAEMEKDVDSSIYDDIAEQLILREPGNNFNVIMGGGRRCFTPKSVKDPDGKHYGERLDKVNLIEKWKEDKEAKNKLYKYVSNREELLSMNETQDYILGLFASSHMDDHVKKVKEQPTLEEMTEQAIKVLQKAGGDKGFFLFVEGGRIDMAHHSNQAQISLDETIEFSKAVDKAISMTNEEDTLIVVTSDHAHVMNFNGYAPRTESIFGFAGKASDGLKYTSLSYSNGPGYSGRKDLTKDNTKDVNYVFPAGVPLSSETHGGDDVAVFARGPNAQLFSGSYEQNYIPHAMAFAANLK